MIYEIARYPEVQARMRAEILEVQTKMFARGDPDFTALDFESMHYTVAVLRVRNLFWPYFMTIDNRFQECLRTQSASVRISREVIKDDVLPLHKPITTLSGRVINEIPIAKGTRLYIATQGYHL